MERKTIEQAAQKYADAYCPDESSVGYALGKKVGYIRGFKNGAQWRINSVWHDASEVPEANKRVLVCFEDVIGEYVYYRIRAFKPNVLKNWNMGNFSLDKVLYWCYLDDLLPERKEETK